MPPPARLPVRRAVYALTPLVLVSALSCREDTEPPTALDAEVSPAAVAAACPGDEITVTDLGTLPGDALSQAGGINNAEQVVGFSGTQGKFRAFIWTASAGMRDLGQPPAGEPGSEVESVVAADINDEGVVAGSAFSHPGSNDPGAFVWTETGGYQFLSTPTQHFDVAVSINDRGEVVGRSGPTGFIWSQPAGVRPLGTPPDGTTLSQAVDINNDGVVVVNTALPGFMLWTEDGGFQPIGLPPGAELGNGSAINDHAQVVGTSSQGAGATAFLWSEEDGFLDLGGLPGLPQTFPNDINESAQVVGAAASLESVRGFVWSAPAGMQELRPLPGDDQSQANKINDRGEVVGISYKGPDGFGAAHAVLWTLGTTPEASLERLAADIEALVASGTLGQPEGHALRVKLDAALRQLKEDHTKAARNLVRSFRNQVEALVRSGRLSDADAQPLRDGATCLAMDS